jgi:SAM-dependent methyltransferase
MVMILLTIIYILVLVTLLLMLRANNGMVPYIGSPHAVVAKIAEQFELTKESVFYDVGAGDGRVVFEIAKRFPNTKAIGVELALFPYALAKIRLWIGRTFLGRYRNVTFLRKDFQAHDFSDATHMYVYLYPKILDLLITQLLASWQAGKQNALFLASGAFQSSILPIWGKVVVLEKKKALIKELFVYMLP